MKLFKSINKKGARIACAVLAIVVAVGIAIPLLAQAGVIPQKEAVQSGVTVYKNSKATVDASNLPLGFVSVSYTGGKDVRIKVQITKTGGTTYTYNLNNKGTAETFPLTEGNGRYSIKVYENTTGTKYALAFSTQVDMTLRNVFLPYLYPNQYVNYTADCATVKKAAELTAGKTSDLDKISAVYYFVTDNFTYDYNLANTVQSGYLPDPDETLATGQGICFDYAALAAAMLRSQGIPTKLITGYVSPGDLYHAWNMIWLEESGWITVEIEAPAHSWERIDLTFAAGAPGEFTGDGTGYTDRLTY